MAVSVSAPGPQQLDVPAFIQQVKQRPVIWNPACSDYGIKHKMAAAWRQVCVTSWPSFDTWSADDKRAKCLDLQKRWKSLQQTFTKDYLGQKRVGARDMRRSRNQYYDQLDFLAPTMKVQGQKCDLVSSDPIERKTLKGIKGSRGQPRDSG
uniref:MADF domain-containing protein n=2 Tax=Graphocephala atropunctata TaxID=36148 RepID=A0A1B6LZZ2_9HEMI